MRFGTRKKNWHCINTGGFTLIEVIVASVILFTCLSVTVTAYTSALRLAGRASAAIRIDSATADIRLQIKQALSDGQMKGQKEFQENLTYAWTAAKQRVSRNIPGTRDEISGSLVYGQFLMTLYQVQLTITCRVDEQDKLADFDYLELIWVALPEESMIPVPALPAYAP